MSSNIISFMEHKWNADLLIEDLTDEFYETGTDQIKYWLTINKEEVNLTEKEINGLSLSQLKEVFINTSLGMVGMTFHYKDGLTRHRNLDI